MKLVLSPLYAIVDAEVAAVRGWSVSELAAGFLDGGATTLQLRGGRTPTGTLLSWANDIVERAQPYGASVILNDRADVARMSGAAGIHLGQDDLPFDAARRIAGAHLAIGLSTHTQPQLEAAARLGVDYAAVGPVYATRTKATGYEPVGLDRVRAAAQAVPSIPIVAIGGITLERAPDVIAAGATAVAVITDLVAEGDPSARVRRYVERLEK